MPRKPGLGPAILRIELMSTGHEYRPSVGVDDFTGLPIVRVQDTAPVRALPSAQELQDAANRTKRMQARTLLAMLEQPKPKPQAGPFKRRF